jgi:peptidyl-prolyl cis-trans isomerase SurA
MFKNNKRFKIIICCIGLINCIFADNLAVESRPINKTKPRVLTGDSSGKNNIQSLDRILVFVNKGVITSNQVNVQLKLMQSNYKQKGVAIPQTQDFKNSILNQMVTDKVELDLAERMGIKATDLEVSNAINNMIKAQKISLKQFKERILRGGITYNDLQQQASRQIVMEKLKQREVDSRVVVSDEEVNRVLASEAYKKRIDYNLSYIIISVPEQATPKELQAKTASINQAYSEITHGKPFNDVSAQYSNAPNALEGGILGWKSNVALPGAISSALQGLKNGQITKVIRLPMGFLIFKVNDIRSFNTQQIVKQYDVRHILIKVNENSSDDEAHHKIEMIKAILDKYNNNSLSQREMFVKLAKQYSEDTSSVNGGDIGWVGRGDTVGVFEDTMLNIPVGKLSDPIRTPFGWHILMVDNVRNSDQTTDREKSAIRQELREVKATLLYAEWLRNIRDSAYIKMNDN